MVARKQEQLNDLRALLERRKEHLVEEIRSVRAQLARDRHSDADAVADVLTDVDHAMVARDFEEIRDIDAALRRIGDGNFGICIDCGAEINHERIIAYPTAKRCFSCQVQHERTYKRPQTPAL